MFFLNVSKSLVQPLIFYVFYTILLYISIGSLVNITPGYVVTKTSKKRSSFQKTIEKKLCSTFSKVKLISTWDNRNRISSSFWTMDRSSSLNSKRNGILKCVGIKLLVNLQLKCCVKSIQEAISFRLYINFDEINELWTSSSDI